MKTGQEHRRSLRTRSRRSLNECGARLLTHVDVSRFSHVIHPLGRREAHWQDPASVRCSRAVTLLYFNCGFSGLIIFITQIPLLIATMAWLMACFLFDLQTYL